MELRGVVCLALVGCAAGPVVPSDPGPAWPTVEVVTQQEILTPLPMRVRLPARYGADRVVVFVHTWGTRDWAVLELVREGQTWSGEVSCRAVSTVTGDTRYFFLALDARGEPVVGSGSPEWPHVATIVSSLRDGPQALSGDPRPLRCHDPADCPPDFPGCPPYAFLRPACSASHECADGSRCEWDGYCGTPPESAAAEQSDADADASEDELLARAVRRVTHRYRTAAARPPER